jgi:hypothetical protein
VSPVIPFPTVAGVPGDGCAVPVPVPLHDAVAEARRRHRALVVAAAEWALARGLSLPADHVALWAATARELGLTGDVNGVTGPWRAADVIACFDTVAARCTLAGCAPPADLAESLWHLYGFLSDTGRLHSASDSLQELRAAVVVFGNADRFAHPAPLPPKAA